MEASDIKKMTREQLNKLMRKKVQWLKDVVCFVNDMIIKLGPDVVKDQDRIPTHMIGELYNFQGFSFYANLVQNQAQGNIITIWFHPESTDMNRKKLKEVEPVLKFHFSSDFSGPGDVVEIQSDDKDWKKHLNKMMLLPEKFIKLHMGVLAAEKVRLKKGAQKFEDGRDKERELLELRKRAEKLKVYL